MSTLYYLPSELLSKVGREINEAMENLKLEAIISFLQEKGVTGCRGCGVADQVCPFFDPLSCRFFYILNLGILACSSFYRKKLIADGIKGLDISSNS